MRALKHILYLLIGEVVGRAVAFLAIVYIARELGAEELGTWGYAVAINSFLILFYTLGLDIYALVESLKKERPFASIISDTFAIKSLLFSLLLIGVGFYALFDSYLAGLLGLLLIADYLQSLYPFWFYQARERFATITAIKVTKSLLYLLLILPLLYLLHSLYALALTYALSHLLLALYFAKEYLAHVRWDHIDPLRWRGILYASLLMGGAMLFTQIYNSIDRIMITHMLSLTHTGYYEAGYKLYALSIVLFGIVWNVYAPKIARSKSAYKNYLATNTILSLLLALGLYLFGDVIVRMLYGEAFAPTSALMPYFALNVFVVALSIAMVSPLSLLQKNREWSLIALFTALLNIALNYALIPVYGLAGAIVATLASELLAALWAGKYVRKWWNED